MAMPRVVSAAQRQLAQAMRQDGYSYRAIAARLGWSYRLAVRITRSCTVPVVTPYRPARRRRGHLPTLDWHDWHDR